MTKEEIDISLALDPSDGKIPEEGSGYGTFVHDVNLWKDVNLDSPCGICGKSDPDMARYMEKSRTGDPIIYCQECFYTDSEWARTYKPVIEEKARRAKYFLIFVALIALLIFLRGLPTILEILFG